MSTPSKQAPFFGRGMLWWHTFLLACSLKTLSDSLHFGLEREPREVKRLVQLKSLKAKTGSLLGTLPLSLSLWLPNRLAKKSQPVSCHVGWRLGPEMTKLLWVWVITCGGEEMKKEGGLRREREKSQGEGMRERIPKLRFGIMNTPGWCYIFCVSLLFKAFFCKSLFQLIGKWCWKTCFSGTIFFISY